MNDVLNKTSISVWADHADSISCAYSGTGALKTDFTRTGKRGFKGLLQDGVNSVMRYMKNNYFDGTRQVCYSLEPFFFGSLKCVFFFFSGRI